MCHLLLIAQLSQDQSYLAIHSCWLLVYFQMFRDSDSIRDINFHHYEINVHSVKPSIKMALNNKHKNFIFICNTVSVGQRNGAGKNEFDCIFKIHVR